MEVAVSIDASLRRSFRRLRIFRAFFLSPKIRCGGPPSRQTFPSRALPGTCRRIFYQSRSIIGGRDGPGNVSEGSRTSGVIQAKTMKMKQIKKSKATAALAKK